jgi:hypothetical protein
MKILLLRRGKTYRLKMVSVLLVLSLFLVAGCGGEEESGAKIYVGSVDSDGYHYPFCSSAGNILLKNQIWFSSPEDARSHGYRACSICNPPTESPRGPGQHGAFCTG